MNNHAPRIGMIGIGGMGSTHLKTLRTLHHTGCCRLTAVADPTAGRFPDTLTAFEWEGIAVYDDYRQMIERDDIDAVIISTPIQLHARQTIDSLASGKHVYLEKPPCATLMEYREIESAWRASGKVCAVGFQMQAAPVYSFVRDVVRSGKIGELERIWATALWPRDDAYYARSGWSGRMHIEGSPVFDGPATNALGHVVHAAMSIAGDPIRIRGALKRARPIESFDTAYLEADTASGVNVRLLLTHATTANYGPNMRLRGSKGEVSFDWGMNARLTPKDGCVTKYAFVYQDMVSIMMDFFSAIEGVKCAATELPDSLPFLYTVNGALKSNGGISSFAPDIVSTEHANTAKQIYAVKGLDDEIHALMADPTATPTLVAPGHWVEKADIGQTLFG